MIENLTSGAADLPEPKSEHEAHLLKLIRAAESPPSLPNLGVRLRPGPQGLYAPVRATSGPSPIDLVQVYATAKDILGFEPGLDWAMATIDQTHLSDVLNFATAWTARAESISRGRAEVDHEFAERYLTGDALARAKTLLESPRRRLVIPQALLVLIKVAIFRCGRAERAQEKVNLLPAALFVIASGLNSGGRNSSPDEIVGEIVANQHFNYRTDPFTNMALYEARWHNPEYAEGQPLPSELFERTTGVHLDDFAAVVLACWSQIETGGLSYFEASTFADILSPEALTRVLQLISATPERMREEIEATEGLIDERWNSVPWTFSAFERFPLIEHNDGWYVVSPKYLLNRLLTWIPVFDVKQSLDSRGLTKEAARFESRFRTATERYVQDLVATTYEQIPGRVFTERKLRAHLGRKHKVADVAIDYGHSWIVAEISTRRLMRDSAHGGASLTLESEVDALCKKFEQIHSTIKRIRETKFQGLGPAEGFVRFYPVLILTEGYPVNPFILGRLHEVLRMKKILTGGDTATPEVIDLSDLEVLESLAQSGGPTLVDVIRSKQSGPLHLMDITSHVRKVMNLRPARPERLEHASSRMISRVIDAIAPPEGSPNDQIHPLDRGASES